MGRTDTRSWHGNGPVNSTPNQANGAPQRFGSWLDYFLVRTIFFTACVVAGYHFCPFGLQAWSAALLGAGFALAVINLAENS